MPTQCLQSLSNGQQCTASAINGTKFCRHHDPSRPHKETKEKSSETEPLILPPLLDKPSVLLALNEVLLALGEGRIKRSVADTLLSIIKLANRLLTEITEAGLPVYSVHQRAAHNIYEPTFSDLDEFKDIVQNGTAEQLRDHIVAKQTGRAKQSGGSHHGNNGSVALAASGNRRKGAVTSTTAHQPTDRYVEELMAKSHELIAKNPKLDTRFMRA
jgi:hypothetical protein